MVVTQNILDSLTEQAKANPRKRMNLDLRNNENDTSQRILNAIEPESVIPIHRHRTTSETIVSLRGSSLMTFYDEQGRMTESYEMKVNGDVVAVNVPISQWHTVKALESGTVIMCVQNGKYQPITEEDILKI